MAFLSIAILFSEGDLLAVNKPPGISVHDAPGPGGSLLRDFRQQQGWGELFPVHRLDKDASGVLLFANTKATASAVQRDWEKAEKHYIALCEGIPFAAEGVIDAPILEHQTGKPERMANALKYFERTHPGEKMPPLPKPKTSAVHPAGRSSQTHYRVLESFKTSGGAWSLLQVRPQQGRMHQIRVHLAHLGCPLAVDALYGRAAASTFSLTRMPLHAAKLTFSDPVNAGRRITVEAPLTEDIQAALSLVRGLSQKP